MGVESSVLEAQTHCRGPVTVLKCQQCHSMSATRIFHPSVADETLGFCEEHQNPGCKKGQIGHLYQGL